LYIVKNDLYTGMDRCDKALAKIEAYSKEYHTAGRAAKNFVRLMRGKLPVDTSKESGTVAKALGAPYKAVKACFRGIGKAADGVIRGLDILEQKAEANLTTRQPTLMQQLEAGKQKALLHNRERVVPIRVRMPGGAEI
jgi:hypothetical protein